MGDVSRDSGEVYTRLRDTRCRHAVLLRQEVPSLLQ